MVSGLFISMLSHVDSQQFSKRFSMKKIHQANSRVYFLNKISCNMIEKDQMYITHDGVCAT